MDIKEAMSQRHTVRKYQDKDILANVASELQSRIDISGCVSSSETIRLYRG